jgi:hypothetical protein
MTNKPNPKAKPQAPKSAEPKKETAQSGAIFDAVLDEMTAKQHESLEAETEVEVEEVEEVAPVVVTVETPVVEKKSSSAPASAYAVVGNGERDDVTLSKIVYKNLVSKKSLSVHHVQRRLNERGYTVAYLDKDGFYGDQTKTAMAQFQADNKLPETGLADMTTLLLLFENDSNVRVIP